MIYKSTAEVVNWYENLMALNQSTLKQIFGPEPSVVLEAPFKSDKFYEEKTYFLVGSGVDVKMTQIEGEFAKQFYTSQLQKKPSDTLMSVLQEVYSLAPRDQMTKDYKFFKNIFVDSFNRHDYFMNRKKANWEEDNRIAEVDKDPNCQLYWNDLMESGDRKIITLQEKYTIEAVVDSFYTNGPISQLLKLAEENENYDLMCQVPLLFSYNGVQCKGLADMVLINHKTKQIHLFDIKTMREHPLMFKASVRKRRYDFQGAFYVEGVNSEKTRQGISSIISKDISQYTVAGFNFLVESTTTQGTPLIFQCSEDILKAGKWGRDAVVVNGVKIFDAVPGFHEGVELFKYYQEHGFDLEKSIRETKSRLQLNWN